MKKIGLLFTFSFSLIVISLNAHPWKPKHYVVVDTDAGLDDLRALTLLLSSPDIRVLGITVSNGTTNAEDGYQKVKSLLASLHHEGVLVGINNNSVALKPFKHAENFNWTDSVYPAFKTVSSDDVLERIQKYNSEPFTFINMGSLNTFASYTDSHPEFSGKVKKILWNVQDNISDSYNYKLDENSYLQLTTNGYRMIFIRCPQEDLTYSDELINTIHQINNEYAQAIYRSLTKPDFKFGNLLFDEMSAIYLTDSTYFKKPSSNSEPLFYMDSSRLAKLYSQILTGSGTNKNQTLISFPLDSNAYFKDIEPYINSTIQKFGSTEWTSCVLTNELHRHVGIYAIIGAKMGIRVKDYFGAGVDEMKITSYAGSTPPISCMNDGIQVSTGATVGHGLLNVLNVENSEPKFVFEYLGQKVTFQLKPQYRNELKSEIKQLTSIHGINTNIYWELVRKIALICWFNWDRNDIFDVEVASN